MTLQLTKVTEGDTTTVTGTKNGETKIVKAFPSTTSDADMLDLCFKIVQGRGDLEMNETAEWV